MKTMHALIAIAIATLFTTAFTFASPDESIVIQDHRMQVIALGEDGEALDIDLSDLEEGETRQFFTDSGKEVVATRTEDGITLEVDGKTIELLGAHHISAHTEHDVQVHSDGTKVIVKQLGGEDGHFSFFHSDSEDIEVHGEHHWVSADGAQVFVMGEHKTPADTLLESGVLDQVDESTREEILEVLRQAEPRHAVKRILLEKKDDGEDN